MATDSDPGERGGVRSFRGLRASTALVLMSLIVSGCGAGEQSADSVVSTATTEPPTVTSASVEVTPEMQAILDRLIEETLSPDEARCWLERTIDEFGNFDPLVDLLSDLPANDERVRHFTRIALACVPGSDYSDEELDVAVECALLPSTSEFLTTEEREESVLETARCLGDETDPAVVICRFYAGVELFGDDWLTAPLTEEELESVSKLAEARC